jgi:hypothetical protein
MKKNVLKPIQKINRKKLIHAKKSDILENKFQNLDGEYIVGSPDSFKMSFFI